MLAAVEARVCRAAVEAWRRREFRLGFGIRVGEVGYGGTSGSRRVLHNYKVEAPYYSECYEYWVGYGANVQGPCSHVWRATVLDQHEGVGCISMVPGYVGVLSVLVGYLHLYASAFHQIAVVVAIPTENLRFRVSVRVMVNVRVRVEVR